MQRFGERPLTPAFLWELMEGIKEPMTDTWACLFLFVLLCIITPLVPENQPPLDENGEFVSPPATYNGLPWWAFKIILLGIVPTVTFMVMAYRLPKSFEIDDEDVMKNGVDPDAVMMTPSEMGRRHSYDERNTLVRRRRSSIHDRMANLNMVKSQAPPPVVNESGRRRLSAMVKGDVPAEVIDADDSSEDLDIAEPIDKEDIVREGPKEVSNEAVTEAVEVED